MTTPTFHLPIKTNLIRSLFLSVALLASHHHVASAENPVQADGPAQAALSSDSNSGEKVVFQLDFSDPAIRSMLEKRGGVITSDGPDGRPAVRFSVSKESTGKKTSMAHFVVPVEVLAGARVKMTAKVRGESLDSPEPTLPLPGYLGGKCQLYINTPSRGKRWLEARALHGTFPWREVGMLGGVLDDATEAQVRIGVEGATGSLWISDLKLTIVQAKAVRPRAAAAQTQPAKTQKRGFMSNSRFTEKDFADLAAWNVNVVRWQMGRKANDTSPYDGWMNQELDDLAIALDMAAAHGIKLVVDMHSAPGDRLPDRTYRMYLEKEYHDAFIDTWQRIAKRFKGHPGLWAYDLINEPVQNYPSPPGLPDWLGIQVEAGKAIREIDPVTPIMIEVDQWDSPDPFVWLEPVNLTNVIYQVHMYWPWEFTHQGIKTDQGGADGKDFEKLQVTYPGSVQERPLDKEALRRYVAPVRDFQLAYGVPIFVGEFSAVRWAPGAARYLDDCISIFEEYGWDWTYHAFRESPVWSVEHANLPYDRKNHPRATSPTDRQQVLQKWFALNETGRDTKALTTPTKAVQPAPVVEPLRPIRKILFVGNSITFHGPSDQLGWSGKWGMAASSEANDYVHQLTSLVKAQQGFEPEIATLPGGSVPTKLAQAEKIKAEQADLIVVQLGENDKGLDYESFQKPYEELVTLLRTSHPEARIVCAGVWRPKKGKDEMIRDVCRKYRIPFADISSVSANLQNRAATTGKWENAGVAWHPNDAGMKGYADAIWAAVKAGEAAIPE